VDDPDLRISGASAGLKILLDQVRDLLGREGVEIERILQGDSDGPILFGRGLFESSFRLSFSMRARHISLLFRKTDPLFIADATMARGSRQGVCEPRSPCLLRRP